MIVLLPGFPSGHTGKSFQALSGPKDGLSRYHIRDLSLASVSPLSACIVFFFNWSILDLQCCVISSFRYTAKWVRYIHICCYCLVAKSCPTLCNPMEYIYIHIYTHTYVYTHTHIHTYIYIHTHIHIYILFFGFFIHIGYYRTLGRVPCAIH